MRTLGERRRHYRLAQSGAALAWLCHSAAPCRRVRQLALCGGACLDPYPWAAAGFHLAPGLQVLATSALPADRVLHLEGGVFGWYKRWGSLRARCLCVAVGSSLPSPHAPFEPLRCKPGSLPS